MKRRSTFRQSLQREAVWWESLRNAEGKQSFRSCDQLRGGIGSKLP